MSGQDARIAEYCEQLKLLRLGSEWSGLAQDAAKREASFADFLEKVLECEMFGRDERRRSTLMRLATMPSVKTLEQFDWGHGRRRPCNLIRTIRCTLLVLCGSFLGKIT